MFGSKTYRGSGNGMSRTGRFQEGPDRQVTRKQVRCAKTSEAPVSCVWAGSAMSRQRNNGSLSKVAIEDSVMAVAA